MLRLWDKPQPTCPQAAFTAASTIGRGDREKGLGAAFQQKLAARAASKRSNCKGPLGLPCAVTPQGTWPLCVP